MLVKNKQSKVRKLAALLSPTSPLKRMFLFMMAFAAIGGGYYLYKSHAQTLCVYGTYGYGSQGVCVKDIQYMANYMARNKIWTGSTNILSTDGVYGSKTQSRVNEIDRQFLWFHSNAGTRVSNTVSKQEWVILCIYAWDNARQSGTGYDAVVYYAGTAAGCSTQFINSGF